MSDPGASLIQKEMFFIALQKALVTLLLERGSNEVIVTQQDDEESLKVVAGISFVCGEGYYKLVLDFKDNPDSH